MGLGRRTREEIVKWNQIIALGFQTGGKTLDIAGLRSGAWQWKWLTMRNGNTQLAANVTVT